jgi:tripartite-type tricarboxylate transporter receptor subunit TctC
MFKGIVTKFALSLAIAAPGAMLAQPARAAEWPSKPIHFLVPFPPGGITDRLARVLAQKMHESFGQPVLVENKPGAAGNIAGATVAKAEPDGYTLLMGSHATHGVNPTLYRSLPYDAVKDFAPISLLVTVPNVLLVHPKVPASNVKELIAHAKQKPDSLNFSSAGSGTSGHMAGQLLMSLAGIKIVHIPNKGPAQALQDAVGGHVDMVFDSVALGMPLARAGKLKALAVTSTERSPIAQDLPTMAEAGLPGYEIELWFAAFTTAGTPAPVVQKLNGEIVRILKQPGVAEPLVNQGMTVKASSPEGLAEHVKREIPKWAKLVKETGARVD